MQEVLPVTEEICNIIMSKGSEREILESAKAAGFKTMRDDGVAKVLNGKTTITELLRTIEY